MNEYICPRCKTRSYSAANYESLLNKTCEKCGAIVVPSHPEERDGIKIKYDVFKVESGEPVFDCFVLRPDRDPAARSALRAYAEATTNEALAADLRAWVDKLGAGRKYHRKNSGDADYKSKGDCYTVKSIAMTAQNVREFLKDRTLTIKKSATINPLKAETSFSSGSRGTG